MTQDPTEIPVVITSVEPLIDRPDRARIDLSDGRWFEVEQTHIKKLGGKKVGKQVQLKVGGMGLMLFNGPDPLESYIYASLKNWSARAHTPLFFFFLFPATCYSIYLWNLCTGKQKSGTWCCFSRTRARRR